MDRIVNDVRIQKCTNGYFITVFFVCSAQEPYDNNMDTYVAKNKKEVMEIVEKFVN